MSGPLVGIDLGTTHTVVAVLEDGGPRVLADPDGRVLIPSAVAFDTDGRLLVGAPAAEILSHAPERGIRGFKRDMGQPTPLAVGARRLSPTQLSALVLREARQVAAQALGVPVTRAVVSVPAWFEEPQRRATREAGTLAGLDVRRIVNEPTAAALAHGLGDSETERTVAVVNLGGGTLDVTVLDIYEGVVEVRATGGDGRLGGEDMTDALLAWVCSQAGLPVPGDPLLPVHAVLRAACERAKCGLSQSETVLLPTPTPGRPDWQAAGSRPLTRADLDAVVGPLMVRLRRCVRDTLTAGGIQATEVDEVLLVGGATRTPAVRAAVTELFGREPLGDLDPDLSVALGAAVQAGLADRSSAVEDLVVTDVLGHSLGVAISRHGKDRVLSGYFLPVLHRNTTLPVRRVERVSTMHPQQTSIRVRVYQGEHRMVEQNRLLGEFEVEGIPALPDDAPEDASQAVDLAFTHDLNGLLEVEATVVETGKTAAIVVEERAGHLDKAARARAIAELALLKTHPRDLLPNRLLLERGRALFARLPTNLRPGLDAALLAFEDAVERQQPEDIDASAQILTRALGHLARHGWEVE